MNFIKWNSYVAAGLLFFAISIFFGWFALEYTLGHASNMGAGYFPFLCSGVLMILSFVTLIASQVVDDDYQPTKIEWKNILFILLAVALFATTVESFGMMVSTITLAILAGHVRGEYSILKNIILGLAISISAYILLVWGLEMNLYLLPKRWEIL